MEKFAQIGNYLCAIKFCTKEVIYKIRLNLKIHYRFPLITFIEAFSPYPTEYRREYSGFQSQIES